MRENGAQRRSSSRGLAARRGLTRAELDESGRIGVVTREQPDVRLRGVDGEQHRQREGQRGNRDTPHLHERPEDGTFQEGGKLKD